MNADELYKKTLLDHYRKPRNKGDLADMDLVSRGRNALCGDDIEIGALVRNGCLDKVKFRGRGCSICIASASIMTQVSIGLSISDAAQLSRSMKDYFDPSGSSSIEGLPSEVEALSAIRHYSARRHCALLSWKAFSDILAAAAQSEGEEAIIL